MSIARDIERARLRAERQKYWYGYPVSDRAARACGGFTIADVLDLGVQGLMKIPGVGLETAKDLLAITDCVLEERHPR